MSQQLEAGTKALGIPLPDIYGRVTDVAQFTGRPVILVFMRHLGCLLTRAYLSVLRSQYGKIQHLRGEVIVLSFEDREGLRKLVASHKLPFVFLLDSDKIFYRQYGMLYSKGSRATFRSAFAYLRLRLSGMPRLSPGSDTGEMGGVAVIGSDGIIRFIHRGKYPGDMPDVTNLLAAAAK